MDDPDWETDKDEDHSTYNCVVAAKFEVSNIDLFL